ncbi:hypothetical protein AAFG22_14865 [Bradyrhizobium sp. B024]|uniref:hypothetical protein n=1 Tax=Bradyrhizobium sp. B024 TaxID=3140247 RepID=UPI003182EC44
MPYVQRNEGAVCGVYANLQPGFAEEFLADDDAEVVAFLNPPPPVPSSVSDRQFFQQLAVEGIITQDDALASNAAVIPPPLLAIIDAMPESQQFAAKMLVSGATVFQRNHPMTVAIGAAYGWDSAQIDAFFRSAAAL